MILSYRAIEMQLALPRTQDIGQLQDQMQQRGQMVQHHLAQANLQEERIKRQKVHELNQKDEGKIKDQDDQNKGTLLANLQHKGKQASNNVPFYYNHPYLGNRIDYNG
ncbi:hypothetical protein [Salirhabdus sp. Marseille-P4669]|uniref:hypothetical protein n=1 Tax=Salirhabdus sp. Marseille-P4669 TaxID=2042310 RepID=UPI001F375313|nr:hypothetical protein [Salirhabdus sp. Marseille-P4669]